MPLSPTQLANLQNGVLRSSNTQVKDILLSNVGVLDSGVWLDSRNKFLLKTIEKISTHYSKIQAPTLYQSYKNELKEYIATSSILHCKDGWDFFSNAIGSLLDGNLSNAIHMAYYAELRAAMSILASDGIGVFNRQHFWIDSTGTLNNFPSVNTHEFVWKAFEEWAKVPAKSNMILELIDVNGASILDWLNAAGMSEASSTVTAIAKDWLDCWSLDLHVLGKDHYSRNDVSYRPQEIKTSIMYPIESKANLEYILNKWQISEPTHTEKYRFLDYYLLRDSLFKYFNSQYARVPKESDVTAMLSSLGMSSNVVLEHFLVKTTHKNLNSIFKESRKNAKNSQGLYRPLPLISRAFLLLRVSTAFVKDSMRYAGYNNSNLEFWWKNLGKKHGLWENGNEPTNIDDLWSDVDLLISDVNDHLSSSTEEDMFCYHRDIPNSILEIRKFQKAYLWGLGL